MGFVVIAALLLLAPAAHAQTAADTAPAAAGAARAPVVLQGDTLFWVETAVGSFTARERAAAVVARLKRLAGDPYLDLDSVRVRADTDRTAVVIDGMTVIVVTDADAAAAAMPRDSLALAYARSMVRVLREQGFVARTRVIIVGVLFALLAAIAAVLAFRVVSRVFPRLYAFVEAGRGTWIPSVRIQTLELLPADRLAAGLLALLRVLRVVVLAALLYVSIPIVLSFFPWTRRYSAELFGYVLTPFAVVWSGLLGYLPNVFAIGAISITTYYLLRLIRSIFGGIGRGTIKFASFYPDWAMPTYQLVRIIVLLFALIAAWPYLPGSDSAAFRGVGVFVGLLLSLGSAAAIGNVIGGVVLTYMRPFRVGDRVKISDTEGDVVEKTLLVTRIRTSKNVEITIPNSMVLSSHIINYSTSAASPGLILHTTVTIGYDVPWRQVHDLLVSAALSVPGILREPGPFVLQTGLSDYYPTYELNAYTDQPNRMAVHYARLHEAIQDRFNEAGVEIMSPGYLAVRDGNASTIPAPLPGQ